MSTPTISEPTQPELGNPTPIGRALPIPPGVLAYLVVALQALFVDGANEMSGVQFDPATANADDAQRWVLAQLTLTEAAANVIADHQRQLVLLAKRLGISDKRMGEAWGITEQGASRRKQRATQQQ